MFNIGESAARLKSDSLTIRCMYYILRIVSFFCFQWGWSRGIRTAGASSANICLWLQTEPGTRPSEGDEGIQWWLTHLECWDISQEHSDHNAMMSWENCNPNMSRRVYSPHSLINGKDLVWNVVCKKESAERSHPEVLRPSAMPRTEHSCLPNCWPVLRALRGLTRLWTSRVKICI